MSEKYKKVEAFQTCSNKGVELYSTEKEVQDRVIGHELGMMIYGANATGKPPKEDFGELLDWLIVTMKNCVRGDGKQKILDILNQFED